MLRWSGVFFIVAIIAGVFGFTGVDSGAGDIARHCFLFFLLIFVISLIWDLFTPRKSSPPL